MEIKLGDVARDSISGLEGVVVCISKWLYGCTRVSVQPQGNKDGKPFDLVTVDMPQLTKVDEVIDKDVADPAVKNYGPRDDKAALSRG